MRSQENTRVRRGLFSNENGAVGVEFALIAVALFALIFAAIEVGRTLMARNEMSHAMGRVSRMLILDGSQTSAQIETMVKGFLSDYDADELNVTSQNVTVAGVDYIQVTVGFPFDTSLPLTGDSTLTLSVDTAVPIVSPTF